MPLNKNKMQEQKKVNKTTTNTNKHILFWDLNTEMLLILHWSEISSTSKSKTGDDSSSMHVIDGNA